MYGPVPLATLPDSLDHLRIGKHRRCCHADPWPPRRHGPVAHFEVLGSSDRTDQSDESFHHLGIPQVHQHTKSNGQQALTSIPGSIHCAATPEDLKEQDELDEIASNNFLDTLAEVAMAVANRRLARNQKGDRLTE